jgi:nitrite reductase/ring-hydroxylating ferredoxin subunit/uncharacterized membrane protein
MLLKDLVHRVESLGALDGPGLAVQDAVGKALAASTPAKNALNGTWLGHPLHPMLTDIPIGTWTAAVALDWVGGKGARKAADRLLALGTLSAIPTAVTGAANYADFHDSRTRRIGIVHAAANDLAIVLFAASWRARKRGRRVRGRGLALAGMGTMAVGGYLGGHLSYGLGRGVDRTAWEERPSQWTDAIELAALPEGKLHAVDVEGVRMLLYRHPGGTIDALSNTCTHMGGPLAEGELTEGEVTKGEGDGEPGGAYVVCPWHGSTFRLRDGGVVRSPAVTPQPRFETRTAGGLVQVKEAT